MAERESEKSRDKSEPGRHRTTDEGAKRPLTEDIKSGWQKEGNDSGNPPNPPEERGIRKGGA